MAKKKVVHKHYYEKNGKKRVLKVMCRPDDVFKANDKEDSHYHWDNVTCKKCLKECPFEY